MQSNTPQVVIFERNNVAIKRKKMYPSPDYSTIGNKDNTVCLYVESGKTYIKVFNPNTGRVYMLSLVQSMTNPALNEKNPRGVHLNLVNLLLKPQPSHHIFIFMDKESASVYNACVSLATKAAKAEEYLVTPLPDSDVETSEEQLVDEEPGDFDAETIEGDSVEGENVSLEGSGEESLSDGDDESNELDDFPATQDFNVGAKEYAQEILATYNLESS